MQDEKMFEENLSIKLKDGRILSVAEYGVRSGLPTLYFHGFPGSRLEAKRFHEAALSTNSRLIGIDRPGMGLSTIDKNRSVLSWAEDVAYIAEHLCIDKISILGHSGGAPFVAACAYAIPQKIKSASIVSGMAPFEIPQSKIGMAKGQIIANGLVKSMPWFANVMMWLTRMMLKNPNKMLPQMIKQLTAADQVLFRDPKYANAVISSTLEAFRNGIAGPAQEMKLLVNPWGFDLKNIKCPVTIWHGNLDTQVPISHGKIYADLIPGAKLNILENEGHHSALKNHIIEILQ